MDGENNGKTYFLMGDVGVPLFLETPIYLPHEFPSQNRHTPLSHHLSVGKEFLLFLGHILGFRNGIAAKHRDPELSMARLIIIPT